MSKNVPPISDPQRIRSWLRGPIVAAATPFKEDNSLDLNALHKNIRFMIDGGVQTGDGALLVAAAAGEHPTLSVDERKAIMELAVEAAQGQVPVMASVQHTDCRVIEDLANFAGETGIAAVQLAPTYYYRPTEDDVLRLFRRIAACSDVTLMIYHTWWNGVHFSIDLLRKLAEIETVRVLKWSSSNDAAFRNGILALRDDLVIIDNSSHHILSHLLGCSGFITHLSNFWPQYPLALWRLLEKEEYAAANDHLATFKWEWGKWRDKVIKLTSGEGPFIKAAMEQLGLRAGPPRPPCVRPPEHLQLELQELLHRAGVPLAVGAT